MEQEELITEIKECNATLDLISKKLDALITVLTKEGITNNEEVEAILKEKLEK